MLKLKWLWLILTFIATHTVSAVYEKKDGDEFPWGLPLKGFHDRAIIEKLGQGFFMNVGPTGIRARITHEHPCYFTVKFVFENSPAHDKIKAGDIIVGANGEVMTVPHRFGRNRVTGWEGPMSEMARLVEDSQAKNGQLELIVWPQGKKEKQTKVMLQIDPVGRFATTFPYNCERSDKLMLKLCDFLMAEYKRENGLRGSAHVYSTAMLALMASGESRYNDIIQKEMTRFYNKTYDSKNGLGYQCWSYGFDGILMGEYYHLHKDKKLLPAIKSLNQCMEEALDFVKGSYSHRPFPFIRTRIYDNGTFKGGAGYGSVAFIGSLTMAALAIFKQAKLEYSEKVYRRIHEAYLSSMNANGAVGYGFRDWQHAVVQVEDPQSAQKGTKGIGFPCPDGMIGLGDYKILWPTKKDPRYRDTSWLEKEKSTNLVYDEGGDRRLIIRYMPPEEPKKPFPKPEGDAKGHGRSGLGALAHLIGNNEKSWIYTGNLLASGSARSYRRVFDGHASTLMHPAWSSLAAAMADKQEFRQYMDGIKWWFIMAQTHDNGFVAMPGRDYASTDHVYATRKLPSAVAALILSVKDKKLLITGSGSTRTSPPELSQKQSTLTKLPSINEQQKSALNALLLKELGNLSAQNALRPITIPLSKTKAKIWLSKAEYNGTLTFKALKRNRQASFNFAELTLKDCATLARLTAALLPDSKKTQAMAALYMYLAGSKTLYKSYLAKSTNEGIEALLTLLEQ